jgi:DNA-binding PadR family transcriptional regulator
MRSLALLDYALLGLLYRTPASGYDIRKVVQSTPLGRYSDSPGSIYPALERLRRQRLIAGRAAPGGRQRQAFTVTDKGRTAFRDWLSAPIGPPPLDTRELDLKLGLMSEARAPREVRAFLARYADALRGEVGRLAESRRSLAPQLSYSSTLALSMGIAMLRQQADWCQDHSRGVA